MMFVERRVVRVSKQILVCPSGSPARDVFLNDRTRWHSRTFRLRAELLRERANRERRIVREPVNRTRRTTRVHVKTANATRGRRRDFGDPQLYAALHPYLSEEGRVRAQAKAEAALAWALAEEGIATKEAADAIARLEREAHPTASRSSSPKASGSPARRSATRSARDS